MGPDPTQAYFLPAVNKRLTRGTFRPDLKRIFWPEEKKIEKFDIFRGNFPNSNPNHKWLTRPHPGSKFFDPDPSLLNLPLIDLVSLQKGMAKLEHLFSTDYFYQDSNFQVSHSWRLCLAKSDLQFCSVQKIIINDKVNKKFTYTNQ